MGLMISWQRPDTASAKRYEEADVVQMLNDKEKEVANEYKAKLEQEREEAKLRNDQLKAKNKRQTKVNKYLLLVHVMFRNWIAVLAVLRLL